MEGGWKTNHTDTRIVTFYAKQQSKKLANTEVTRYKREKLEMRDGARGRGT